MAHLRTLKIVNFLFATFFGAFSLIGLVLIITGVVHLPGQPKDALLTVLVGLAFFVLLAGLAFAHAYTGFMVTAGRARHLQTALAVLHLPSAPIGTVYAIYALWLAHFNPATTTMFDRPLGRRVS